MNKFIKKLIATVMAASMVISTATVSMAADKGWRYDEAVQEWQYIDSNGDPVSEEWHKSGENDFYLGDNGYMVRDTVIENSNGTYSFVNADGAQVNEAWVWTIVPSEDYTHWIYIQKNGDSVDDGWKTINEKRYHFTDNIMDYGFLDADGNMIDGYDQESDAWTDAVYYCGPEADGSRYSGWLQVDYPSDFDEYDDYDTIWLYFDSNGKKVTDTTKNINGIKYRFDDNGVMVKEWYIATSSDATATSSNAQYFNDNGAMAKGEWVYTTSADDEDGEEHWYYFKSNGDMITNDIKKIDGKYYAFDEDGVMLTGFVAVDEDGKNPVYIGDADEISAEDLMNLDSDYMYFAEEAGSPEGAAETGKTKIELVDDEYTIMFSNNGVSKDKLKQDGYLYINGVLQTADEDGDYKYEAIEVDGTYFIVNKNGKILTKNASDNDSTKWFFKDGEAHHMKKNDDTKEYDILIESYQLHD